MESRADARIGLLGSAGNRMPGQKHGFFNASTREPREGRDAGIYLTDYCECGAFTVKIKITENDCILSEYKV